MQLQIRTKMKWAFLAPLLFLEICTLRKDISVVHEYIQTSIGEAPSAQTISLLLAVKVGFKYFYIGFQMIYSARCPPKCCRFDSSPYHIFLWISSSLSWLKHDSSTLIYLLKVTFFLHVCRRVTLLCLRGTHGTYIIEPK